MTKLPLPLQPLAVLAASLMLTTAAAAQSPRSTGPVIQDYGAVFAVPDPGLPTPMTTPLKIAFDVQVAPDARDEVNGNIESAARFLNMHGQAGVPRENVAVGVVLHGGAVLNGLSHAAYRKRFGMDNPNLPLLEALAAAGARIYMCGQSAAGRGVTRDEVAGAVKLALSAMTAHVILQNDGFRLSPF